MAGDDDRLVKELLKARELPVRQLHPSPLQDRLLARQWRRPAGSSPRLWKHVGTDDPFARPDENDPAKILYVAERFVRIDKSGKVDPMEELQKKAAAQPPPKPKREAKPDGLTHTPSTTRSAPNPLKRPPAKPSAPQEPIDRSPPRPAASPDRRATRAGRFVARPQASRGKLVQGGTPPGGMPPGPARESTPQPAPPEPSRPAAPARPPPRPSPPAEPPRPSPPAEPPRAAPPAEPPRAAPPAEPPAAPPAETARPPAPRKAAEPSPAQPAAPPRPDAGMDDLFGAGAMEGRVRIGRRSKPKPSSEEGS